MSELHMVSDPRRQAVADVIFVHGLGGDAFATWQHDANNPKDSWPAWLADDLPNTAVHCLAYDASPFQWLGSSMPLTDRATNLLTTHGNFDNRERRPQLADIILVPMLMLESKRLFNRVRILMLSVKALSSLIAGQQSAAS